MTCRTLVRLLAVSALLSTGQSHASMDCSSVTPVYAVQGAGHVSAFDGDAVETCGVVTAVGFSGYYIQALEPDEDVATSDGIFVAERTDKPDAGTAVKLSATVEERIPGGPATGNLSVTTLTDVTVLDSMPDAGLPEPVLIGKGGRVPPDQLVISADETAPPINLQNAADDMANTFNPDTDGIDFYESLEGMLVSVSDPVAVSAIRQFGTFSAEVFVLADDGEQARQAGDRTTRGGIRLGEDIDNRGDQNPERIQIQFDGTLFGSTDYPAIKVSDRLEGVTGVVGYSFGNFEIIQLGPLQVLPATIEPQTTGLMASSDDLTIAAYNVLNLSAVPDDDEQRALVAAHIADKLRAPDIVALQEIQDNNGDINDCPDEEPAACAGVLDASLTLQSLVDAIVEAGGPAYEYATEDPLVETADDNRDDPDAFGGVSLGNIRNAYLYNPERVELLSYQNLTRDVLAARGVSVPSAFDTSRDPLQGFFLFNDQQVQVLNNHFTSRFGSSPIFGGPQPFVQAGEAARANQSLAMHEWVRAELSDDPDANIVVLGDLNTFEFTDELARVLPAASGDTLLVNLIDTEIAGDAYSFIFEGNSQALDHVFVTPSLAGQSELDYVHVNVDFPRLFSNVVGSDHEPVLARLRFAGDLPDLGLRGEVYSGTALELFWNRVAGADTYQVYVNDEEPFETAGISYFSDALQPGSRYRYRVVALMNGKPIAASEIQLQTRGSPADLLPPPVIDLRGVVYSPTALEIFWMADSDAPPAAGFNVFRDGVLVASRDARSYFDDGLMPGVRYLYEVQAIDAAGRAGPSRRVELTTDSGRVIQPLPVANLTGQVYSSTATEIFWEMPVDADTGTVYEVYRDFMLVQSNSAMSYFENNLAPGTSYQYSVRAINGNGVASDLRTLELTTFD